MGGGGEGGLWEGDKYLSYTSYIVIRYSCVGNTREVWKSGGNECAEVIFVRLLMETGCAARKIITMS